MRTDDEPPAVDAPIFPHPRGNYSLQGIGFRMRRLVTWKPKESRDGGMARPRAPPPVPSFRSMPPLHLPGE